MVLDVLAAAPFDAAGIRVWLSREPRLVSPIGGAGDALDCRCWQVSKTTGAGFSPTVEEVIDGRADPDLDALYPDAWSVDVRVDRRLVSGSTYLIVASSDLESADGADFVSPAPDDRASLPGMSVARSDVRAPSSRQAGVDLYYDGTRFRISSSGDLEGHAGASAAKKRIERRLITAPGGFFHLARYGLGFQSKKPHRGLLEVDARRQVLEDSEVIGAEVSASSLGNGLWKISVRAKISGGDVSFSRKIFR